MAKNPADSAYGEGTNRSSHRFRRALFVIALSGTSLGLMLFWYETSPEVCYRRGRQAIVEGDRDAVLRASDQLIHTAGYQAHGSLLKGLLFARAGKANDAIQNLQQATGSEPLAVEALTALSQCYYQLGMFLQAIDSGLQALAKDSTALEARRWLAAAYYDLGAVSQAASELDRISQDDPQDPRPDRLLGLIAKDSELYPKAISHYRQSLKRDPHQPGVDELLQELAESQIKIDQFEEALGTLKDCKTSPAALTLEARCHAALGRFDVAEERLRQAIRLDPRYVPALLVQGKLLLDDGKAAEAAEVLTQAIPFNPHDRQLHFQLSQALRALGKFTEADAEMELMLKIQQQEREFSDLHDQAASQPENAEIRFRTGELAELLGKPDLATVWFRAALAIDPNHSRSRAGLERQTRR